MLDLLIKKKQKLLNVLIYTISIQESQCLQQFSLLRVIKNNLSLRTTPALLPLCVYKEKITFQCLLRLYFLTDHLS